MIFNLQQSVTRVAMMVMQLALLMHLASALQTRSRYIAATPAGLYFSKRASLRMHFEEAITGNRALKEESLFAQRYVATNRFKVRPNAGPKFEKRWADRKSRLAQLPGFRFFTLLRRISIPVTQTANAEAVTINAGDMYVDEGSFGNYISLTIWETKANFDAWRTGDAFKEAHGGGGIIDFIKLLSTALFILDGAPKPAFYDALLPVVGEKLAFESEGGWRTIAADGKSFLSPEVFVSQNRFSVVEGQEVAFEKRWGSRESRLQEVPGFVGFFLLRRDASKADDGYNYIATTLWKDQEAFKAWMASPQFTRAHRGVESTTAEVTTTSSSAAAAATMTAEAGAGQETKPAAATDITSTSATNISSGAVTTATAAKEIGPSMFLKKPKLAFYEGKLVLSSPVGI